MGDQCGVPVAANTRREKAREADVVGYCPFSLQSIARACLCVLGRPMARTPIGLLFSPVLIPPPPLFVCLHV